MENQWTPPWWEECYLGLRLAPFDWRLYARRDMGFELGIGPLRIFGSWPGAYSAAHHRATT